MVGAYTGTYNASTNPTTGLQIGTQQDGGSGVMVWSWGGVVLVSTSTGGNGVITPYTPPGNTWIHVAYTCTAISGTTQIHSLYVNGTLMAQSTNALQVAGQLTQIYINGYPQTPPLVTSISLERMLLETSTTRGLLPTSGTSENSTPPIVSLSQ